MVYLYPMEKDTKIKQEYRQGIKNLRHELSKLRNHQTANAGFDIITNMSTDNNSEQDQLNLGLHKEIDPTPSTESKPEQASEGPANLGRRKFLIASGLIAGAGILGYLTKVKLSIPDLSKILPFSETEQPSTGTMVLGEQETSLHEEMLGYMSWTPDGPITYWTTAEGKRRYLLTGGQDNATYMLESDGKRTLKDIMASGEINQNSFKEVYGPDQNVEYRREYAGITSVLQIDKSNQDHLLGIAHCEQRTSRNASGDYTATVGLAESFDGGSTWQDKGPLIIGTDVKAPGGGRVSGAGQPSAVLNQNDGYAYIMYIDWSAKGQHPDQLYMARAKANDNGTLGQVEYYTNNGFSNEADINTLKSVIPVPTGSNMVYEALSHMSWNTDLNQYTCQGECDTGFWTANSSDLLNWSEPQIIYNFTQRGGKPHSILKPGEKWDSYPTALSEDQPDSEVTDKSGIFYHSSGDNLTPHEPATVDFTIQ